MRHALFRHTALAGLTVLALCAGAMGVAAEARVFAAASLKTALDEVVAVYSKQTGKTVHVTYAGSSVLARQIELGAPADLFISANPGWMDVLDEAGLVAGRKDFLSNRLVLIAGQDEAVTLSIASGFPLAQALGHGRLAMALVDAVPAGIYGREALISLGVWDAVHPKVAQTDNVRAALRLVSLGAAPMGIVYATDARAEPGVRVLGDFPQDSHSAILYPAALLRDATDTAKPFWRFLTDGPEAQAIFAAHGFLTPEEIS